VIVERPEITISKLKCLIRFLDVKFLSTKQHYITNYFIASEL
jgi:hypothetical protein